MTEESICYSNIVTFTFTLSRFKKRHLLNFSNLKIFASCLFCKLFPNIEMILVKNFWFQGLQNANFDVRRGSLTSLSSGGGANSRRGSAISLLDLKNNFFNKSAKVMHPRDVSVIAQVLIKHPFEVWFWHFLSWFDCFLHFLLCLGVWPWWDDCRRKVCPICQPLWRQTIQGRIQPFSINLRRYN